jgi:hypothetical protein
MNENRECKSANQNIRGICFCPSGKLQNPGLIILLNAQKNSGITGSSSCFFFLSYALQPIKRVQTMPVRMIPNV